MIPLFTRVLSFESFILKPTALTATIPSATKSFRPSKRPLYSAWVLFLPVAALIPLITIFFAYFRGLEPFRLRGLSGAVVTMIGAVKTN